MVFITPVRAFFILYLEKFYSKILYFAYLTYDKVVPDVMSLANQNHISFLNYPKVFSNKKKVLRYRIIVNNIYYMMK